MPDDDPCANIPGAAGAYCDRGSSTGGGGGSTGGGGGGGSGILDDLDPVHQLGNKVAEAAAWTARQLGDAVSDRNSVDFTSGPFLQQYAIVFAASTVLVLVLWLLAVAKRAMRGVPISTALGEAVGLLWLAVGAAAFTPLILYVLTGAVSAVTDAMVAGFGSGGADLFTTLGDTLKKGGTGGGPIIQVILSLVTILLCGALWLLLVLRALALYVGALLGVVVYAGLVDRDLWGHVRRWAAFMVSLILIEPIIVIVLGLASALQSNGERGPVITGLAVSICALGAAIFLMNKFPGLGDSIRTARAAGRAARTTTGGALGAVGAVVGVQRGIDTHAARTSPGTTPRRDSTPRNGVNPVAGGMGAHGSRTPKTPPPKKKDD
ncbi:hypothetical protein ACF1FX_34515 [Streptomyces sp. NPDC014646]|uniref:hypothetical protein n=1 Tax=Streptomyces sp. NPDC014646 TaxID=3364877 RepID=UPI0036FCEA5E